MVLDKTLYNRLEIEPTNNTSIIKKLILNYQENGIRIKILIMLKKLQKNFKKLVKHRYIKR